jgi:hypothetical protein
VVRESALSGSGGGGRGDSLLTASIGDSRAVLGAFGPGAPPPRPLTADHHPARAQERARIESSGGSVGALEGEPAVGSAGAGGKGRVFVRGEAYPGLATARAFGDRLAKSVGVTAKPELSAAQLNGPGQMLVPPPAVPRAWPRATCSEAATHWHGFTPARLYTGTALHRHGFTPARLYTGTALHRQGFTPVRLYTGAALHCHGFTPARLYTCTA